MSTNSENRDTVLVASSGNAGLTEDGIQKYPARFLGEVNGGLSNLIVAGATDGNCRRASWSNQADWMITYAP